MIAAAALLALQLETAPLDRRIAVDRAATLPELAELVRTATGANVFIDPRADVDGRLARPLELPLRDVPARSALAWAAWRSRLALEFRDGVAVFSPPHRLPRELRRFDPRAILPSLRDHPAPAVSLPADDLLGFTVAFSESREAAVGDPWLVDLVKTFVAPGSWEGETTIEQLPDRSLVVAAPRPALAELDAFLRDLARPAPPAVTLTARLFDAPAELPPLPALIAAADLDAAARRLGARLAFTLSGAGASGQRFHVFAREERAGVIGFSRREPVVGTWTDHVHVLDARPRVVDGGRLVAVELHLSTGTPRELPALDVPGGKLALQERGLARLESSFLLPRGGAVLFALPSGRLCLLQADVAPASPAPPAPPRPAADPALRERLAQAPPADLALDRAPVADFASWLRSSTGLNVLVGAALDEARLSARLARIAPARALELLLPGIGAGFDLRLDALVLDSLGAVGPPPRLLVVDTRDVLLEPGDFPAFEPEDRPAFTGEDLANLIKNSVFKERWQEEDGAAVGLHDALLILRNRDDVLDAALRFVDERRRSLPRLVAFRAELLDVPAAENDGAPTLDADGRARLLAKGRLLERLAWIAVEGRRSHVSWTRAFDYVSDFEGDSPLRRALPTRSWIETRALPGPDGVRVDLSAQDERIAGVVPHPVGADRVLQLPVASAQSLKATLVLPPGRVAVLRRRLASPDATDRVLLLEARPLPRP